MQFRCPPPRYIVLGSLLLVTFHYLFSFSSDSYASRTSLANLKSMGRKGTSQDLVAEVEDWRYEEDVANVTTTSVVVPRRANAAFVILARNSDVWEIVASIRGMEGTLSLLIVITCSYVRSLMLIRYHPLFLVCPATRLPSLRSFQRKVQLSLRFPERRSLQWRIQEAHVRYRFRTLHLRKDWFLSMGWPSFLDRWRQGESC